MPRISKEWGEAVTRLLDRHGLTPRAAMLKVGGIPSHTTIIDWKHGIIPSQVMSKVWPFMSAFPREEAVECLEAGGLPIPPEWRASGDPAKAVTVLLDGYDFPEEAQREVAELVRKLDVFHSQRKNAKREPTEHSET